MGGVSKKPTPSAVYQHTVKVPEPLEQRVRRCMELEGLRTYTDFMLSALTRRCRQIEREHAEETTPKPTG